MKEKEVWKDVTDTVLSVIAVWIVCIVVYAILKFM